MDHDVHIAAADAQRDFQRIVDQVTEGAAVTVTRGGVPVARIVPVEREPARRNRAEVVQAIRAFSHGRTLGGLSLQDLIAEGRR